jgi:hypothetical protein
LFPGELSLADGEEAVSVVVGDLDGDDAGAEGFDATEEEANQVHDVFPFDGAFVAQVGGELFELGDDVAVVGLIDELCYEN